MFVGTTFTNIMLCREAIGKILARGHSRVPVYSGNPKNIIGLLLVCNNSNTDVMFVNICYLI